MATLFGMISKELGVYYLIGAFLAGVVSNRLVSLIKREERENLSYALTTFSALFIPVYFFSAGFRFSALPLSSENLLTGVAFGLGAIALKVLFLFAPMLYNREISHRDRLRLALSICPNLVFGLVLVDSLLPFLTEDLSLAMDLVVATLVMTLLPPLLIRILNATKPDVSEAQQSPAS